MVAAAKGKAHEHWSTRLGFILAAIGSAVGLGNLWKFPYMAGANGGGAFVLVYLGCVVLIALPILVAELMIGRAGGGSAVASTRAVALLSGASRRWAVVGWIGMIAAFLILTFYSVIGGWFVVYVPFTLSGAFVDATAEDVGGRFSALLADPWLLLAAHAAFMSFTVFIVARGVQRGIERGVEILLPALFAILVFLVGYSALTGAFGEALAFLFTPDFSKIDATVVLAAIGQAFFSIGVGAAIMLTYGAYLTRETSIPRAAVYIAFADTSVALLAGLAIFPIVFAYGLAPSDGPGLVFVTLPIAFGQMPLGTIVGSLFFFLGLFAAVTSSISILEITVSWLLEWTGWSRRRAAITAGGAAWVLGIITVLSFNVWSEVRLLPIGKLAEKGILDLLDYVTSYLMMPACGLLLAILAGWVVNRQIVLSEYARHPGWIFQIWQALIRFAAPVAIALVMISSLWDVLLGG